MTGNVQIVELQKQCLQQCDNLVFLLWAIYTALLIVWFLLSQFYDDLNNVNVDEAEGCRWLYSNDLSVLLN